MEKLVTKQFCKWLSKQNVSQDDLIVAIEEIIAGNYEASLGSCLYKKRIRFAGQGKSGSGRTIICYKKEQRLIFIHGFAKNEKSNLGSKELHAFKEFSKILLRLTKQEIDLAIRNGDLLEVEI